MTHTTIEIDKKGSCLSITLNRPQQRNALNEQMIYDTSTDLKQQLNAALMIMTISYMLQQLLLILI